MRDLVRLTETYISYLRFSIKDSPVILRVVGAPTPTVGLAPHLGDMVRKGSVRRQAPYPTERLICSAFECQLNKRFGRSEPLPYNRRYSEIVGVGALDDPRGRRPAAGRYICSAFR